MNSQLTHLPAFFEKRMNRIPAVMLAVLLTLGGVLIYAIVSPDLPSPGADIHPEQKQMHVAGRSAEYDADMTGLGAITGVLMITVFVLALLLGAGHNGADRHSVQIVAVCCSLPVGTFVMMTMSCHDYVHDPSPHLAVGLPVPSAWMIFGVWLTPLSFLAVYTAGFRRWVMTTEDRERLQALLALRGQDTPSDTPEK